MICSTTSDFGARSVLKIFFVFYWSTLSDNSWDFELAWGENLSRSKETHFKILVFINFEEFFERFFEHWVAKAVSHDVKTACHLKTLLHLDDTDLVEGCNEYIQHNTWLLSTGCTVAVKCKSRFEMSRVFMFFLYIQVWPNLLRKFFIHNFARADRNCTTK